jgi:hypothetical protein
MLTYSIFKEQRSRSAPYGQHLPEICVGGSSPWYTEELVLSSLILVAGDFRNRPESRTIRGSVDD